MKNGSENRKKKVLEKHIRERRPGFTVSHRRQVQAWRARVRPGCHCPWLSARLPCTDGCSLSEPAARPWRSGAPGREEAVSSSSLLSNTAVPSPDLQGEQLPVHSRWSGLPKAVTSDRVLFFIYFHSYKPPYLDSTQVQKIWSI